MRTLKEVNIGETVKVAKITGEGPVKPYPFDNIDGIIHIGFLLGWKAHDNVRGYGDVGDTVPYLKCQIKIPVFGIFPVHQP